MKFHLQTSAKTLSGGCNCVLTYYGTTELVLSVVGVVVGEEQQDVFCCQMTIAKTLDSGTKYIVF